MKYFYFDSGTTNTRGYLLDGEEIVGSDKIPFGSKDIAVAKGKESLAGPLKGLFDQVCVAQGCSQEEIIKIYASGMVTSPYGFLEVDHLLLPVNHQRLHDNMVSFYEGQCFKREIFLIPGIKTLEKVEGLDQLETMNNTRGEEIQAIGIAAHLSKEGESGFYGKKYAILFPGSHTHGMLMRGDTIEDAWSMFAGEMFYSLTHATVLASEVDLESEKPVENDIVIQGLKYLKEYGIARALYLVHTSRIFEVGDNLKRRDLLSGIICGSVAQSLRIALEKQWHGVETVIVYGSQDLIGPYVLTLEEEIPWAKILRMDDSTLEMDAAVMGLQKIVEAGRENHE